MHPVSWVCLWLHLKNVCELTCRFLVVGFFWGFWLLFGVVVVVWGFLFVCFFGFSFFFLFLGAL